MSYFFYFLFFNAYWASFDIGHGKNPIQNAKYYMMLLMIFVLSGFVFILTELGVSIDPTFSLVFGFIIILGIDFFLLSKKVFDEKLHSYEFIKIYNVFCRDWIGRDATFGRRFHVFILGMAYLSLFDIA